MINKVYIFSYSDKHAGGLESMHQLCYSLNKIGIDSSMVYFPNPNSEIPLNYRKYNLLKCNQVEDHENNVIILPETILDIGYNYLKCKKVHYWLSVNFFFELSTRYLSPNVYLNYSLKYLIKSILVKPKYFFKSYGIYNHKLFLTNKELKSHKIINLAQSEYASEFLKGNDYPNVFHMNDFIHNNFFKSDIINSIRANIILYNPLKGKDFTRELIKKFPQYEWKPIINLSPLEVSNLLLSSKIYIDFGEHPGRDRIPREAVLSGICIITGKKGSAANKIDISIPEKYKIVESEFDFNSFSELISDIFNNFHVHQKEFDNYRNKILNDEDLMKRNCDFFVHYLNNI